MIVSFFSDVEFVLQSDHPTVTEQQPSGSVKIVDFPEHFGLCSSLRTYPISWGTVRTYYHLLW